MGLYFFTLISTTMTALIANYYRKPDRKSPNNVIPSPLPVWVIIIILVSISGFRYMNDYLSDEYIYRLNYLSYINMSLSDLINSLDMEWGWDLLNWTLSKISTDPQLLILFCAIVTNVLIIRTLARYAPAQTFALSVFLYVAGGLYFATFNVMRQYLALSILLLGIKFIIKKKPWKYMFVIVIASSIHFSAWVMLPLYFFVNKKKLEKMSFILLLLSIVVLIYFPQIVNHVLPYSEKYSYFLDFVSEGVGGVNPLRVVAWLAPFILLFIYRKKFLKSNEYNYIFFNFSLLSAVVSLISLAFIYVARLDIYFGIYNLITLPQVTKIFNKKVNAIILIYFVIFFLLFGLYQILILPKYDSIFF